MFICVRCKTIARFDISLKAMRNKINLTRENLGGRVKVCAVIKANAYGFGMGKVASYLKNYVDYFAVARVYEVEKLRFYGVYSKVLILSPVFDTKQIITALKLSSELTIDSIDQLVKVNKIAESLNVIAKVHIKVDTGMNRFGVKNVYDFRELLEKANGLYSVSVIGLYSHFACADNDIVVKEQCDEFDKYVNICHKMGFYPLCHISSSRQANNIKCAYDMVRLGIDLYEIDDCISFSGEIIEIKTIAKGECIGYNYTYKANKNMVIACVNIGYADIAIDRKSVV